MLSAWGVVGENGRGRGAAPVERGVLEKLERGVERAEGGVETERGVGVLAVWGVFAFGGILIARVDFT